MKNSEKIEGLLQSRINSLSVERPTQRLFSGIFSGLSAVPFLVLGIFCIAKPNYFEFGPTALVAAVCAIGLTILIWNIGSNHRERLQRLETALARIETIQLCLLAIPEG